MLRRLVAVTVAAGALGAALPGVAGAGFTVSRQTLPGGGGLLQVTGTQGKDGLDLTISSRDAAVDREEVVEIVGGDGPTSVPGCSTGRNAKGITKVTCVFARGGAVAVDLLGGDDTLLLQGNANGIELPAGSPSLLAVLAGDGKDRVSGGLVGPVGPRGEPLLLVRGGAGDDVLSSPGMAAELQGDAGDDVLAGDRGDDVLLGGPGEDRLLGDAGNDLLDGGTGGDRLDGEAGFDTVAYGDGTRTRGVEVTLDNLCNDGGPEDTRPAAPVNVAPVDGCAPNGVDRDFVRGIEAVRGTERADTLIGGSEDDLLFGLGGDDTVEGGNGVDTLVGGAGVDLLLARDQVTDAQVACGLGVPPGVTQPPPTPGDRAVLDQFDPAGTDCPSIERGGGDVTGPADERPAPSPPPADRPADPPPPPAAPSTFTALNGGGELGRLPGGGIAGKPPEVKIITRSGTPDRRGRLSLRIACVYQARECVSKITLTAGRTCGPARAGRRSGSARARSSVRRARRFPGVAARRCG